MGNAQQSFAKAVHSGEVGHFFHDCCFSERGQDGLDADPSLDRTVAVELDKLFARFDRNSSGSLDKSELPPMLQDLKQRGYKFSCKDDEIIKQLFQEYQRGAKDDVVDVIEFRLWFRNEVIARPDNLRTLLGGSAWVLAVINRLFNEADKDRSGKVTMKELKAGLKGIFKSLGEPIPKGDEAIEAQVHIMESDNNTDKQLSLDEWKVAMINLMAGLFYSHFQRTFEDPTAKHNIAKAQKSFTKDRHDSFHAPAESQDFDHKTNHEHHKAACSVHEKIILDRKRTQQQSLETVVETPTASTGTGADTELNAESLSSSRGAELGAQDTSPPASKEETSQSN